MAWPPELPLAQPLETTPKPTTALSSHQERITDMAIRPPIRLRPVDRPGLTLIDRLARAPALSAPPVAPRPHGAAYDLGGPARGGRRQPYRARAIEWRCGAIGRCTMSRTDVPE